MNWFPTSHPSSGALTVAYQEALEVTEKCMRSSTQANLVQCFYTLSALHMASRDRLGDWQTNPYVTQLCDKIISDGRQVTNAHCLLMGINIENIHDDVARALTFGIGHRTLCKKVFGQNPLDASLTGGTCITELFCLTGPLVELVDELPESEKDSQSSKIDGEDPVERVAKALHRFCDSEDRIPSWLRGGQSDSENEAFESEMAFREMFVGIQDALTCYADRHHGQKRLDLEDLSFARDQEAENDAKKILDHCKPGVSERALVAAQMMKSITMAVGPSAHSQYQEAHKRLRDARRTYQSITGR